MVENYSPCANRDCHFVSARFTFIGLEAGITTCQLRNTYAIIVGWSSKLTALSVLMEKLLVLVQSHQ